MPKKVYLLAKILVSVHYATAFFVSGGLKGRDEPPGPSLLD